MTHKTDLDMVHRLRAELGLSENAFADYLTIDREYMHKYFRGWVKMEPSFAEILAVASKTPSSQWMFLASLRKTRNYTPEGVETYVTSVEKRTQFKRKARNEKRRKTEKDNRRHDKRVRKAKRSRW